MSTSPPPPRFIGSLLLFLILCLVLFYGAWYFDKVTSNNLVNLSAIMGGVASVLWAGHSMGDKASRKLDGALSHFIPHSRLTLVLSIAAALGLAVFIILLAPWHSPVFDYVYLSSMFDETAYARVFKYAKTCAVVACIAVVAIFGPDLIAHRPNTLKAIFEKIFEFLGYWAAAFFVLAYENTLTLVIAFCVIVALLLIGMVFMSLLVSPFVLSQNLKELAGGPSITVALVFLLCCLALVLFVSGVLMPPQLGPAPVPKMG